MTTNDDIAIAVRGLVKIFDGQVRALDGLDLEVRAGTVLGLLGPNGAGKTTAVRALATLVRPDAGTVRVGGHDPAADSDAVRQIIGLAGQNAAVDENLTGRENLRLAGRLAHVSWSALRRRSEELLERFDLSYAADRLVRTYSGGMRRRLDLAAALVHRPPILFLDEPTAGLDPRSRSAMWVMIRDLVAEGTTVLLTTQYLEEADELADRIVVIDRGRAIAEGTAGELKTGLPSSIEVDFASTEDASRAAELLARDVAGNPELDGRQVKFEVAHGREQLLLALRLLGEEGLEPHGVALTEPTLDDVFMSLTGRGAGSSSGTRELEAS